MKKAAKTAEIAKLIKAMPKFVIAAVGHGFMTLNEGWAKAQEEALEFSSYEEASKELEKRQKQKGFPQHAGVLPGPHGMAATLDAGARAALQQHFPRLREVDVKDSPYKLLEPVPGVSPVDLTIAERAAMAERLNLLGGKLPKYSPKTDGMAAQVAAAKAAAPAAAPTGKRAKMMQPGNGSAISQETREKMEKVGNGAAAIMQKAEAQRKKDAKKPKATADGKKPKAAAPKGRGIGSFCEGLLAKGRTSEEILAAVGKEFPGAKTSMASIAWYKNKMANEGRLPKEK